MFKHSLIRANRNLKIQSATAIFNIVGLSISLTCVFLIFLWVSDELSFDKFNENYNEIHRFVLKGNTNPGSSFVGVAFHGLNDSTYDAIYFRPFNFKNPDRKNHSLQYISMPQYDWYILREEHYGVYENMVTPIPNPDDWFHVAITVNYPEVKVYVDNSKESSLTIHQLSSREKGWVGFWVGNYSEGSFRNLKISDKTK